MTQPNRLTHALTGCYIFFLFFSFISCNNEPRSLTQKQSTEVKDSIRQMMNLLAKDISNDGPIAWLTYFEKTPDFFMASEGQLVFPNYDAASVFINNTLIKQVRKIELQWSDVRIDPLTTDLADIGATWHEEMTNIANGKTSQSGYFTAIAEKKLRGWQLRNAHWSAIK